MRYKGIEISYEGVGGLGEHEYTADAPDGFRFRAGPHQVIATAETKEHALKLVKRDID